MIKAFFSPRPWWANGLLLFCAYMTFVYLPFDLFYKPVTQDQEVWFGILFTGWSAKLLAIPHWFVYAWGLYGFYHMQKWMWPWAGLYVVQVGISMLVWQLSDTRGTGLVIRVDRSLHFCGFSDLAFASTIPFHSAYALSPSGFLRHAGRSLSAQHRTNPRNPLGAFGSDLQGALIPSCGFGQGLQPGL